jgi:hypothetical protein
MAPTGTSMAFSSFVFERISAQDHKDPEFLNNSGNAQFQELDLFERYCSSGYGTSSRATRLTSYHRLGQLEFMKFPVEIKDMIFDPILAPFVDKKDSMIQTYLHYLDDEGRSKELGEQIKAY